MFQVHYTRMSNYGRDCIHVSCGVAKNYIECLMNKYFKCCNTEMNEVNFDIFVYMLTIKQIVLLFCIYIICFKLLAPPTGSHDVLTKELKRHDIEYFL